MPVTKRSKNGGPAAKKTITPVASTSSGASSVQDRYFSKSLGCLLDSLIFLIKVSLVVCGIVALLLLFIMPALVKVFPSLPKEIVFLNAVRHPFFADLTKPEALGLPHTRNHYMETEKDITIGVWHTLPSTLADSNPDKDQYEGLLASGLPIILYCHGNTGTRASSHRVKLYQALSRMGYHVLSLDYRGYGDSTGTPTSERGVVQDVKFLYSWIMDHSASSPIYIWGHSLGTGICTKAMRELTREGTGPKALVLESPFNNLVDASFNHQLGKFFNNLWWFEEVFVKGIHLNGIYLETDKNICHVKTPILILHAEDDTIVPYFLGQKLYNYGVKHRPSAFGPLLFKTYPHHLQYGHKWICDDPDLEQTLKDFFEKST